MQRNSHVTTNWCGLIEGLSLFKLCRYKFNSIRRQSFSVVGRVRVATHLGMEHRHDSANPLSTRHINLGTQTPGTVPTRLWYTPIGSFELHSRHMGLGFAV